MARSIIIIGAGIGGLTTAIRLAQAGYDVTILERNPQVGGKICAYRAGGFRWDVGPALFTAKPLIEALFQDVGRNLEDYLRLLPVDPLTRYFFPDSTVFNARRDWAGTAAEISQLDPDDVEGYLRFLAYAARLHRMRRYGFGKSESAPRPRPTRSLFWSWLRAAPFRSAYSASRRYVTSEKLQRVLAHYTTCAGGSPYAVPATFCELAHAVLNEGLWYPRDGVHAIAQALEKLARELDVSIRLGCPVKEIEIKRNRAIGVTLETDGECLQADAVISNIDRISTARYLLPEKAIAASALRSLIQTPMSSSAFIMLLGIRGTFPQLAHHNVFFSDDYRTEFDQIFRREVMPDDPTITLSISCKTDPLHAPVNQENWLIQVNAPPLSEKVNWAAQGAASRERILTILYQRFGLDLRDRIRIEKHLTPADLQRIYGAWRGALYGELPHGRHAALSPPQIRSKHVKHLYQVGGTVVPGGGISQALLSGSAATAMVRQDLK